MVIGMGGRLLVASALAFSVGALTGCGNVADSGEESPRSSSVSVSTPASGPSELPVPLPTMPPEMANNDAVGAEAALRYFLEIYGYTYQTQDVKPWEEVSDSACVFCKSVVANVRALTLEGNVQVGGLLRVDSIELTNVSEDKVSYVFSGTVVQERLEVRSARGVVLNSSEEKRTIGKFILARDSDAWRLVAAGASGEG